MWTDIRFLLITTILLVICSVSCRNDPKNMMIKVETKSCSVEEFDVNLVECDEPVQNGEIQNGISCTLSDRDGNFLHMYCLNGDFKRLQEREKRAIPWAIIGGAAVGGAVIGGVLCYFFCKDDPPPPNKPPSITCGQPKPSSVITAGAKKIEAVVTWDDPTTSDPENDVVSVSGGTPKSGSSFGHGQQRIVYYATDSHGNMAVCDVSFKVTVNYCRETLYVKNGRAVCDRSDKIYGTECTFECNDGYELTSDSVTSKRCEGTSFTTGKVECKKKRCTMPDPVCNGNYTCTNDLYEFDSVCYPTCNDGYETELSRYLKCNGDDWEGTNTILDCEDAEPPEFVNCPASITRFADRGSSSANNITWDVPTAIDNSQQGQVCGGTSTVTVKQTGGQVMGTNFNKGNHMVTYTATDGKGLSATCSFLVIVEVISCAPLQPSDNFVLFRCPNGFSYGSSCDFSCFLSYVLKGDNQVTCELDSSGNHGKWAWTNDTETYCEKLMCPNLPAPANGALACSTALGNQICTMSCNEKFQPPLKPPSEFVCNDEQEWIQGIPPNCTQRRNPNLSVQPGELVYFFSGDCNDATVQDGIKNHFITVMHDLAYNRNWSNICPSFCNISAVSVTCGPVSGRRRLLDHTIIKRSTSKIAVNFELLMEWLLDGDYWHNDDKINAISQLISTMANNGEFDYDGVRPVAASTYSSMRCKEGGIPDYYTETCSGCTPGTYLATDKCVDCAKGFYEEDEFSVECIKCPKGKSTEGTGSSSQSDCIDMCAPGTFSNTGVESCTPCSLGEYQPSQGQTSCQKCSLGKSTQSIGATSESDCIDFDVTMTTGSKVILNPISTSTSDFAVGFWLMCTEACDSLITLKIAGFSFNVGNNLAVSNAGENSMETSNAFKTKEWVQVIFVWVQSSRKLQVHVNGMVAINKGFSTTVDGSLSTGDKLEIQSNNQKVVLSGLSLTGDITSAVFNKTCSPSVSNPIYTMSNIIDVSNSDIELSQSQCDEQNECLGSTNPCGKGNVCHNKRGGYECTCLGGYSGANCETPPDFCSKNNCTNGATCQNLATNYTCKCVLGYKGPFCGTAIVNGGWSSWLEWSECSASCAPGGTKTRLRTCDNPPPDDDGADCVGSDTDSTSCNTDSCPECPSQYTLYKFKNQFSCSETDEYKSCSVTCEDGYVFVNEYKPLLKYECGWNTSYQWTGSPPPCTSVRGPPHLGIDFEIPFYNVPCTSAGNLATALEGNLKETTCMQNQNCQTSITTGGCNVGKRRKRSTSNLEVYVTFYSSLNENANLDLEDFYASNIVSGELATLINTYTDLAMSAFEITNNTNFTTVDVNGVVYTTDLSNINFTSAVNCSAGGVEYQGICADCPTGTYWNDGLCVLCPIGTYQNESRQLQCIECPSGYSTLYTASRNETDCSVPVSTSASTTTTTTTSTATSTTTSTATSTTTSTATSTSTSIGNSIDTSTSSTSSSTGNAQDTSSTSTSSSTGNAQDTSSTSTSESTGNAQDTSSTSTSASTGNAQDTSSTSTSASTGNAQDTSSTSTSESTGNAQDTSSTSTSESTGNAQDTSSTPTSSSTENAQDTSSTSTSSSTENAQDTSTISLGNAQDNSRSTSTSKSLSTANVPDSSTSMSTENAHETFTITTSTKSPSLNAQDSSTSRITIMVALIVSAVLLGMIIMGLIIFIKYRHEQRLKTRMQRKSSFVSVNMVHPVVQPNIYQKEMFQPYLHTKEMSQPNLNSKEMFQPHFHPKALECGVPPIGT